LLAIKQQIADAKNRVEVSVTQDFVDHRPVNPVMQAVKPPVRAVVESESAEVAEGTEGPMAGALAAATDLVKAGKRK
jgi:hypothetical protein